MDLTACGDAGPCDVTRDETRNVTRHVTHNVTGRARVKPLKVGPGIARCPACGQRYGVELAVLFAGLCCIMAPPPSGWCAWCGDELEQPGRVFCNRACSVDYTADVAPSLVAIAPFTRHGFSTVRLLLAERDLALEERGKAAGDRRYR